MRTSGRVLKNRLFARRLKKVQVQDEARSAVRGVLSRVLILMGAPQRRAGYPFRWVAATPGAPVRRMGPAFFSRLLDAGAICRPRPSEQTVCSDRAAAC